MEHVVPMVKPESEISGDEALFSTADEKIEVTTPQLPVKFEARAERGSCVSSVKIEKNIVITNLPVVKPVPGSPPKNDDEGEGSGVLHTDIEILLPDIKQECLEHSRKVIQRTDSTLLMTIPASPQECNPNEHSLTHAKNKVFSDTNYIIIRKQKECLNKQSTHFGEKVFSCILCKYACHEKTKLSRHMHTHTGEKPFACTRCKFTCNRRGSLTRHMLVHSGEKLFSCTRCTFTCNEKGSLKTHTLIHTGEKPFSCTQCKFTCNQKGSLTRHMLTHSGEKPFTCKQCKYACREKGNLKIHMLTHSGEKLFSCPRCTYTCNWKRSLKVHTLTHTDEKLLSCDHCTFTCFAKGNLRRHMLTHNDV